MYRLLLLLVILGAIESHWHRHGYSYHRRHGHWRGRKYDTRFHRLASHVIDADRDLQQFCRVNANCNVRELFEDTGYKLVYPLPHCSVDYISIRIKHRVLYMTAKQIFGHRVDFVDMRILPDMLNLADAEWDYKDGTLDIFIPYKFQFRSSFEMSCGEINTRVINVRHSSKLIGFRMGGNDYEEGSADYDSTEDSSASTEEATATTLIAETPAVRDEELERLVFKS